MSKCIDVSSHNGDINWKKVKASGINNCIIKIIQKSLAPDNRFEYNYTNANAAGMQIGVYNYSYATNVNEARAAALAVIKNLKGKQVPLCVWLDVEDKVQQGIGHLLVDIINTYAYEIVKAGYKFGIYTGLSFYNSYLRPYSTELPYAFWVARYPSSNIMTITDEPSEDKKPALAGKYVWAWQYTSKGTINGIDGFVDISKIYDADTYASPTVVSEVCYIGHASKDEKGTYSHGMAGDQTGLEVYKRTWYNPGWQAVFRPKTEAHAEKLATAMEQVCENNNIGYSQSSRLTLYEQALAYNWQLDKIATPCNCDCSSAVAVCCIAAGIVVPKGMSTSSEYTDLQKTGKFEAPIVDATYTTSKNLLKRGDILWKSGHTAIVLGNGSKNFQNPQPVVTPTVITPTPAPTNTEPVVKLPTHKNAAAAGWYETTANLRLRTGAGPNETIICTMPKGSKVMTYGDYLVAKNEKNIDIAWLGVAYDSVIGYCSVEYLKKI